MSSVQPPLHFEILESPNNLVNLSSDSSEGAISNIPLPTPAVYILVSNSKCSKHSKSVFTLVSSSSHSNLSRPLCHPNICEYFNVIQCLRRMASFPRSRNELASIDCDKIAYHKLQYLPPSYNGDVILSCWQVVSLFLLLRTLWTVWISNLMVRYGATPSPPIFTIAKASLLGNPYVLANWFITTKFVTSSLDLPSGIRLSGQTEPIVHSN